MQDDFDDDGLEAPDDDLADGDLGDLEGGGEGELDFIEETIVLIPTGRASGGVRTGRSAGRSIAPAGRTSTAAPAAGARKSAKKPVGKSPKRSVKKAAGSKAKKAAGSKKKAAGRKRTRTSARQPVRKAARAGKTKSKRGRRG